MSRPIDADALIEDCKKHLNTLNPDRGGKEYERISWLIGLLENVPTIKPKPERKTGRWIPEFDGKFTGGTYWFSCSKCKRIVPEVRNGGWNFCPNCGADMRGEQE